MDPHIVRLWYAYPDDLLDASLAESCLSLLSRDEVERRQFLRFDKDRRAFLASRVNLRCALSQCAPVAPRDWRFRVNEYGKPEIEKPEIEPDCGLRFNVSHSLHLVACVVSGEARVGVDVESVERADEIASIASDVFSAAELAQFEPLRGSARSERALSLWTLTEAYVKARGLGLSLPLKAFSFLFDGAEDIRLVPDPSWNDETRHFRFCLLHHAGHRIALVIEGMAQPEIQIWRARPLLGSPVRVASGGERWF